MDCSTIIVSYNTFPLTREAVQTALHAAPALAHEIIIVDNNSPDQSARRLLETFPSSEYPHVHVLENSENIGFAAANNQGAARATGDMLFFLNPDTRVHGQAIRILYDFLATHPKAGAAGPRVLNEDGTLQKSISSRVTIQSLVSHHFPVHELIAGRAKMNARVPTKTADVDIVKGCALAMRKDVFDTVGGWDESYFMYTEERELCYTLQKAGFTNYYVPEAVITHYGGASSLDNYAEQQIVHQQSVIQFLQRHHPAYIRTIHRVTGTIGFGLRAVLFRVLARLQPNKKAEYTRRGDAAAALFRWFLLDYSIA